MQTARLPKPPTLAKYGLTAGEWLEMLAAQGGTCAVCGRVPESGRLTIDHEHVRGWAKMPDTQRKQYVRGLLCFFCNRYWLAGKMTVERAHAVAAYLSSYEAKRAA